MRILGILVLAVVITYVGTSFMDGLKDHEGAKKAGFTDANDLEAAGKAGMKDDPAKWRTHKAAKEKREQAERERRDLPMNACIAAERAIRDRLKAPSTAKFPGCWDYETRISRDEQTVWVIGHVDAQNSFGAMIRSKFVVQMRRAPGARLGLEIVTASLQ